VPSSEPPGWPAFQSQVGPKIGLGSRHVPEKSCQRRQKEVTFTCLISMRHQRALNHILHLTQQQLAIATVQHWKIVATARGFLQDVQKKTDYEFWWLARVFMWGACRITAVRDESVKWELGNLTLRELQELFGKGRSKVRKHLKKKLCRIYKIILEIN